MDDFYQLLVANKPDEFWLSHSENREPGVFSAEFKDLVTSMIQPHANMRLCMADVIGHAWMQGPSATAEEVRADFKRRHELNIARIKEEA